VALKERYLKVVAVISALALTYIVFSISVAYFNNPEVTKAGYYYYAYFAVVFYMLIICTAWLFMGNIAGGIFLGISFLVAVFTLFVFHDWSFLANGIAFIFIGGLLYKFWNKEHVEEYAVKMKTDDINESTNTLIEEFNREEVLEESLDRKILRISKLREISKDIGVSLSNEELIKKVTKNTIQIIQKPGMYQLYLLGEDMKRLELRGMNVHRAKTAEFTYLEEDKLNQWVFRSRQSVHIADLHRDFRFGRKYESAARSLIASPLITGNRIMGILKISNEHPDIYSVDDLRILAIIANLSALAFYNSHLYETTTQLAIRDGLTGLYTAGFFRAKLPEIIDDCYTKKVPLSLIMLDIDDFKLFNDKHGHIVGDIILKNVSSQLQRLIGTKGLVARYGGEEFSVVLPGSDGETSQKLISNICRTIASSEELIREEKIKVTVSAGVAENTPSLKTAEGLIKAADDSLYKAKDMGKNRSVLYKQKSGK